MVMFEEELARQAAAAYGYDPLLMEEHQLHHFLEGALKALGLSSLSVSIEEGAERGKVFARISEFPVKATLRRDENGGWLLAKAFEDLVEFPLDVRIVRGYLRLLANEDEAHFITEARAQAWEEGGMAELARRAGLDPRPKNPYL